MRLDIQLTKPHAGGKVPDEHGWRHLPDHHRPLEAAATTRKALIDAAFGNAVVFEYNAFNLPLRDRDVGVRLAAFEFTFESERAIWALFHGYRMIHFNASETWLFPPQHWLLRPRARVGSHVWAMRGRHVAAEGAELMRRVLEVSDDVEGQINCLVFVGEAAPLGGAVIGHIRLLRATCHWLAPGHQVRLQASTWPGRC